MSDAAWLREGFLARAKKIGKRRCAPLSRNRTPLGCFLSDYAVGVDNELFRCAFVEVLIALGRVVERDHSCIYDPRNGQAIMQNSLHQLPVILQHRRLASVEMQ